MKIRTDFVTNSSSSSFFSMELHLTFKNGKTVFWMSDRAFPHEPPLCYIEANINIKQ